VQSDTFDLWCEVDICEERVDDDITRFFALGEVRSGVEHFFSVDHIGSVHEVTNASAAMMTRYGFDPWGRRTLVAGADVTDTGFGAHRWHPSGQWLTLYRAYDTESARWLSEDPAGLVAGVNRYQAFANNPIGFIDPLGLEVQICTRPVRNMPPFLGATHTIIYSSKGAKGWGFGPEGVGFPGVQTDGHVSEEDPHDSKSPDHYQCSTVSTSSCVEACVIKNANSAREHPVKYQTGVKLIGGYQCNDWTDDIFWGRQAQCTSKKR
jgi:RHS repeat-associated protein